RLANRKLALPSASNARLFVPGSDPSRSLPARRRRRRSLRRSEAPDVDQVDSGSLSQRSYGDRRQVRLFKVGRGRLHGQAFRAARASRAIERLVETREPAGAGYAVSTRIFSFFASTLSRTR